MLQNKNLSPRDLERHRRRKYTLEEDLRRVSRLKKIRNDLGGIIAEGSPLRTPKTISFQRTSQQKQLISVQKDANKENQINSGNGFVCFDKTFSKISDSAVVPSETRKRAIESRNPEFFNAILNSSLKEVSVDILTPKPRNRKQVPTTIISKAVINKEEIDEIPMTEATSSKDALAESEEVIPIHKNCVESQTSEHIFHDERKDVSEIKFQTPSKSFLERITSPSGSGNLPCKANVNFSENTTSRKELASEKPKDPQEDNDSNLEILNEENTPKGEDFVASIIASSSKIQRKVSVLGPDLGETEKFKPEIKVVKTDAPLEKRVTLKQLFGVPEENKTSAPVKEAVLPKDMSQNDAKQQRKTKFKSRRSIRGSLAMLFRGVTSSPKEKKKTVCSPSTPCSTPNQKPSVKTSSSGRRRKTLTKFFTRK